jgi:hypothetical protein
VNPVNFVLYGIGAVLILFFAIVLALLVIEMLVIFDYNIPDWIKKLRL